MNSEPNIGVTSVEAFISACSTAGRAAGSFGRNLPDFSAQYSRIAVDCDSVTGLPPGPSWSTITGIWPFGFMARKAAVFCSPLARSTGCSV